MQQVVDNINSAFNDDIIPAAQNSIPLNSVHDDAPSLVEPRLPTSLTGEAQTSIFKRHICKQELDCIGLLRSINGRLDETIFSL